VTGKEALIAAAETEKEAMVISLEQQVELLALQKSQAGALGLDALGSCAFSWYVLHKWRRKATRPGCERGAAPQ
jgi:hypothetical protein